MAIVNGLDTNDQASRATLRQQGYYIDNTGVYAPGAGTRAGDTFSGSNASRNAAPSPTQLPIVNGTPVSPSNGFTGPQTNAVMYRGDPQFDTYFGAGTPGYSARNPDLGAGALPAGQATLPKQAPLPATTAAATTAATTTAPAPAGLTRPAPAAPASPAANGAPAYQADFQKPSGSGMGYGPYATSAPPSLTVQGQYADNGRIIEKSVDQFGNVYYQQVGSAALPPTKDQSGEFVQSGIPEGTSRTTAPAQPAAPVQPQATPPRMQPVAAPAAVEQPAPGTPDGARERTLMGLDGKPYTATMTDQDFNDRLADLRNAQEATRQATLFSQGIQQGQLDINRSVAEWNKAYQQSVTQYNDRQLAQTAAYQAMQNDIAKQTVEINKQVANQNALYQQQQVELTRQQQAQTNSLEREKLDMQRQQVRQGRGRRSAVQYR